MSYYQALQRRSNPGVIRATDFHLDSYYNGQWCDYEQRYKDRLWRCALGEFGRITVLHRKTGFMGGPWDVESGYLEANSPWTHTARDFWLASGDVDVMRVIDRRGDAGMHVNEVIEYIKRNANSCVGKEPALYFDLVDHTPRDYMQHWHVHLRGTNSPNAKAENETF